MSAFIPNGSVVSIASTYGVAKTMSAISNAAEAVATLEASHGVIVGDIVEVTSGWEFLTGRIARAGAVATNDVTLEDIVTTSTTLFPAGTGTGTVREVTAWAQIPQILESNSDGGEQQYVEGQYLSAKRQFRKPTVKSAQGLTFRIADDPTLAIYSTLQAANDDGLPRAVRVVLPNGGVIYYNTVVSFNANPTLNVNQIMTVGCSLSFEADLTRYAS